MLTFLILIILLVGIGSAPFSYRRYGRWYRRPPMRGPMDDPFMGMHHRPMNHGPMGGGFGGGMGHGGGAGRR